MWPGVREEEVDLREGVDLRCGKEEQMCLGGGGRSRPEGGSGSEVWGRGVDVSWEEEEG
jgi:hypothetical protein